ncbi:Serine protease [Hyphomicrobiales bacterium]|nr:Serine protease [Hyphomicrobiales bacterium]CAH1698473.1 Serine protease [Hyphomicrobiales bacterium]CAI0342122.1 Serine protease [Hyphomicrobiales bacterium]
MPRIHDGFLDCVIYLYASEWDAEKGEKTGGTGFLVSAPIKIAGQDAQMIYIVTNRHVVENGNSTARLKSINNGIVTLNLDEREWLFHPDGDDLAAYPILPDHNSNKIKLIKSSNFLNRNIVDEFDIGPGDDTFTLGRFINHEGRQQNLPTVRFGNIAQMPWEPVRQNNGFLQDSFLVESRSIGGYSGAPVFVYIPPGSLRHGVANWVDKILLGHGPWLLGVDWGHINDWQPVCDTLGRPINPIEPNGMQVRMNTGIMAVVPAWKLSEMFDRFSERAEEIFAMLMRRCGGFPSIIPD